MLLEGRAEMGLGGSSVLASMEECYRTMLPLAAAVGKTKLECKNRLSPSHFPTKSYGSIQLITVSEAGLMKLV